MQNFLTCAASVSEAHATLISTFLVLLLGFLGYTNNKNRQKREYTLTLFMPLLNEEKLAEAYNAISDWIIQKKSLSHSTLDKTELDLLLRLLGYYEFLSAAILRNDIDRKTILRQRAKSSFKAVYSISKNFIEERRILLDRDSVYTDLQAFVEKHCR
jgi:hypothetical protein